MNDTQKHILLKVARDTIAAVVKKQSLPDAVSDDPELNAHCGCFVTLKNADRLRGCIGQFTASTPLIELVSDMAVSAASRDPRFISDPITVDELKSLDVEISVLSPLEKTDDPLSLRLGVDGIYIVRGPNCGCFLPQVATETGWTVEEFLSYCCAHKAGLPPDAWKQPDTDVYLFTAEVFGSPFSRL